MNFVIYNVLLDEGTMNMHLHHEKLPVFRTWSWKLVAIYLSISFIVCTPKLSMLTSCEQRQLSNLSGFLCSNWKWNLSKVVGSCLQCKSLNGNIRERHFAKIVNLKSNSMYKIFKFYIVESKSFFHYGNFNFMIFFFRWWSCTICVAESFL